MRRRLKIIGPSRLAGRRRLRPVLLMSRKPSVHEGQCWLTAQHERRDHSSGHERRRVTSPLSEGFGCRGRTKPFLIEQLSARSCRAISVPH